VYFPKRFGRPSSFVGTGPLVIATPGFDKPDFDPAATGTPGFEFDMFGFDTPGFDTPGFDTPGLDAAGTGPDADGDDARGGTGGGVGGSAMKNVLCVERTTHVIKR
jgi:hypothetical protein